jgi:hypothetical protein
MAIGIFTNLYWAHSYYLSAIFPALVTLTSLAVTSVGQQIKYWRARFGFYIFSTLAILMIAWLTPNSEALVGFRDNNVDAPLLSTAISEAVPKGEGVLMVGCVWDPTVLYYADRRGVMIPDGYQGVIPDQWVGTEFSYIAFCTDIGEVADTELASIIDMNKWIAAPVGPGIFRILARFGNSG